MAASSIIFLLKTTISHCANCCQLVILKRRLIINSPNMAMTIVYQWPFSVFHRGWRFDIVYCLVRRGHSLKCLQTPDPTTNLSTRSPARPGQARPVLCSQLLPMERPPGGWSHVMRLFHFITKFGSEAVTSYCHYIVFLLYKQLYFETL